MFPLGLWHRRQKPEAQQDDERSMKAFAGDGVTLRTGSENFTYSGEALQDNDLVTVRNGDVRSIYSRTRSSGSGSRAARVGCAGRSPVNGVRRGVVHRGPRACVETLAALAKLVRPLGLGLAAYPAATPRHSMVEWTMSRHSLIVNSPCR